MRIIPLWGVTGVWATNLGVHLLLALTYKGEEIGHDRLGKVPQRVVGALLHGFVAFYFFTRVYNVVFKFGLFQAQYYAYAFVHTSLTTYKPFAGSPMPSRLRELLLGSIT